MANATPKVCAKPGCDQVLLPRKSAKGLCQTHYVQQWRISTALTEAKICVYCGAEFRTERKSRVYCSTACSSVRGAAARSEAARLRRESDGKPIVPNYCECGTRIRQDRLLCKECRQYSDNPDGGRPRSVMREAVDAGDWSLFLGVLRDSVRVTGRGCWLWSGHRSSDGYARGVAGRMHRVVLEMKHGKPLGSQHAHHICANRGCVNPDHLQPVTHRENVAEMMARHSYLKRIAELEDRVRFYNPDDPLLHRIEVA